MKRMIAIFISLSILIAIILFTRNLSVKNKNVDTQSPLAVTYEAQKSEKPYAQSFEATNYKRTGKYALDTFLESILLQKPSHSIYGSTVTYSAENISEIGKTGLPTSPINISTSDILILVMLVFMIYFFTIKSS